MRKGTDHRGKQEMHNHHIKASMYSLKSPPYKEETKNLWVLELRFPVTYLLMVLKLQALSYQYFLYQMKNKIIYIKVPTHHSINVKNMQNYVIHDRKSVF